MKNERHMVGGETLAENKGRPDEDSPKHNASANSTRRTLLEVIASEHPGNSAEAQRERILSALTDGPLTTIEARRWLDCPHPAQRVLELRDMGEEILTYWTTAASECGNLHRFARYVLIAKGRAAA
jgi:hypothetical protein